MFWFVLCLNLTKLLEFDLFYLQKPQYLATIHLNILELRPKEAYLSQKNKKTSFIVLKSLKPTIIGHMKSSVVYKFQFLLNFYPPFTVGNLLTQSRAVDSENECYISYWLTKACWTDSDLMSSINQKPFTVYENVPIVLLTKAVWGSLCELSVSIWKPA